MTNFSYFRFLPQPASSSKESLEKNSQQNSEESLEENSEQNSENVEKNSEGYSADDSQQRSDENMEVNSRARSEETSITSGKASINETIISMNRDESTLHESASICSSSPRPSADESSGVETGYECIDLSFAQHAEPKKQKKKVRSSSREKE